MAARRSPSICLSCQTRQSAIGRRKTTSFRPRGLQTTPLTPQDDGLLLPLLTPTKRKKGKDDNSRQAVAEVVKQWRLASRTDVAREAALSIDALWRTKDIRLEVLRNLSNPWSEVLHHRRTAKSTILPEARAAVVPLAAFRQTLRHALGHKAIRQILRAQLLRCERPREVLQITAIAMQDHKTAEGLAGLPEPIMRAMYRCRQHVSDPAVLGTLNTIITRFRYAKLRIDPQLLFMGLKFAARSRSLYAMKRYLREIREEGLILSSNVFRSVIAKFSIGHRGLGEIRNGRWKRRDLMQVLTGFEDEEHLPLHQQYHLGTFLDRQDWQYLHGWVAVLARCKDSDRVWHEWELWKQSPARRHPRQLIMESSKMSITSKLRGDYWFLEQMLFSGDAKRSWEMLRETGLVFSTLKDQVKDILLENLQYATIWSEEIRLEMVRKYSRDLAKIELALGVQWVSRDDGQGHHELVADQEEVLDQLGQEGWRLDKGYGYPYDEDAPIVPQRERSLHDAPERS